MSKTAWEPAPIKTGVCGSCKHLNKNILSRISCPAKYPCMKSCRSHTEYDKCDVFLDQQEKPIGRYNSKALGNNIASWLVKRLMTQRELAEKIGTTEVSVSRYVTGKRVPSGPLLFKMARALGCTVEDLMQGVFCEPCPKITKEE